MVKQVSTQETVASGVNIEYQLTLVATSGLCLQKRLILDHPQARKSLEKWAQVSFMSA